MLLPNLSTPQWPAIVSDTAFRHKDAMAAGGTREFSGQGYHGQAVWIFEKAGWKVDRQGGSHLILVKDGHIATLSDPDHKELARGTLRSLIRAAGMTTQDFEALEKS